MKGKRKYEAFKNGVEMRVKGKYEDQRLLKTTFLLGLI
jgi:hypothetical protein